MRKKYIVTGACMVALLMSVVFITKRSSHAQSSQIQVPEQIMYRHLFHHVVALKKKAEELEKNGQDAAQFRTHFKRQAELNDEQLGVLDLVATQHDEQEKILEARAKPIIDAYKAQYPEGRVPHGQKPVPPVELRNLSLERDALALRGRDQLRAAFGYDFERFDKFMKTRMASQIRQIPPQ